MGLRLFCTLCFFGLFSPAFSFVRVAQMLYHEGALVVYKGEKEALGERRQWFDDSVIEVGAGGFVQAQFEDGNQVKSRGSSQFQIRPLGGNDAYTLRLFRGSIFLNLGLSQTQRMYEVITPGGVVHSRNADILVGWFEKNQTMEVYCMDGLAVFSFGNLEFSLEAGDKISVFQEKVMPKEKLSGAENRFVWSWYRQGGEWKQPPYLLQFQDLATPKNPSLSEFVVNGLKRDEWGNGMTFTRSDLVMGKLRFEGRIEGKMAHQIIQMTLDQGNQWFDLGIKEQFLLRISPEEQHYQIGFRLRDQDRFYPVDHEDFDFWYQEKGNREWLLEWLKTLQDSVFSFDHHKAWDLLSSAISLGGGKEDLRQEFSSREYQNLFLELVRYHELKERISATIKWVFVEKKRDMIEPVRTTGRVELVFNSSRKGFFLHTIGKEFPLVMARRGYADKKGPLIQGQMVASLLKNSNTRLSYSVEDDLSRVSAIEWFSDRPGKSGSGKSVIILDGRLDEKREAFYIFLTPGFSAQRIYLRAKDESGNWGEWFATSIVR